LSEDKHLKKYLAYLKCNLFFTQKITNIEKSTLSLGNALYTILNVKDILFKCKGKVAELVKTKIDWRLKKNRD
jgi:hypothetical protein